MVLGRLLLLAFVAFASSSPALAYPLNDGTVVWRFEGHGAAPTGGPVHEVTGELRIGATSLSFDALLDGTDPLTGFASVTLADDASLVGAGKIDGIVNGVGSPGVITAPDYVLHPVDAYWGDNAVYVDILDTDGTAFDDAPRGPAGLVLPPPYAPDIALFEQRFFDVDQLRCEDIDHINSFCVAGGGTKSWATVFSVTIDRFIDPVPEPGWLALIALALAAPICVRMDALWRRRNVSSG